MAEKIIEHSAICPIIFDNCVYDRADNIKNSDYYQGKYFYTNEGYLIKVLKYNSYDNVIIEFVYNGNRISVQTPHLHDGSIKNPYKYKDLYEGKIAITNEGFRVQIIKYIDSANVIVKFLDIEQEYCTKVTLQNFKLGNISNPYKPNQYGEYIGFGKYNSTNSKELFNSWRSMFQRVNDKSNNAYKNVIISKEWYNFQNYANWYYENLSKLTDKFKYEIDKDLKQIGKSPKIYSQYTCSLIPVEINRLLVGIYKTYSKHSDLPLGVHKRGKTYQARFSINGKLINLGNKKTAKEAFEVYRIAKLSYIREISTWYYERKGLLDKDYEYIMNKFDILEFDN